MIEAQSVGRRGLLGLVRRAGLLSLLLLLGACAGSETETEVLLVVDSDLAIGKELTAVVVKVYDREGKDKLREQRLTLTDDPKEAAEGTRHLLPLSVSLVAPSQDSTRSIRVVVTGLGPVGSAQDKQVIEQQAIVGFRPRARGRLDMFLGWRCLRELCRETEDLTCDPSDGGCKAVSEQRDLPQAEGNGLMDFKLPAGVVRRVPDGGVDAAVDDDAAMDAGGGDADMPPVQCQPSEVPDGNGGCKVAEVCADSGKHNCDTDPLACVPGVMPGSFECGCPAGYKGSGLGEFGCTDINECEATAPVCDVDPPASCGNTLGSFECACPAGYTGNGRGTSGCVDINECETDNGGCDQFTECMNTRGGLNCGACPAGYSGSGASGCVPGLLELWSNSGVFTPAFSPNILDYRLNVGLLINSVELGVTGTDGTKVFANDVEVAAGSTFPVDLPMGETKVEFRILATNQRSQTYTVSIIRGDPTGYIKASNTDADDRFGVSVAIDGDTLVVGAPGESSSSKSVEGDQQSNAAGRSGAAYVFTRSVAGWQQQAYLKANNTYPSDAFGSSVAVLGDVVVVGAPKERGSYEYPQELTFYNSGAAYAFERWPDALFPWRQVQYMKGFAATEQQDFGASVAISADGLAVGCSGPGCISTFWFERGNTGGWSNSTTLEGHVYNVIPYEAFGDSVAVSGDFMVVGAPGAYQGSVANAGAAFVFQRTGSGTWSHVAALGSSNAESSDAFGTSVAISGDTIAVAATGESSAATGIGGDQSDNGASGSGAVYLFRNVGGTWSQSAYVKSSNTGAGDRFGEGLAVSGDVLVVGAPGEDSAATHLNGDQADDSAADSGAVYVFKQSGGTWSQAAYLKAPVVDNGDQLGASVALTSDTLVVGAVGEASNATGVNGDQSDNSAPNSGAVYIY